MNLFPKDCPDMFFVVIFQIILFTFGAVQSRNVDHSQGAIDHSGNSRSSESEVHSSTTCGIPNYAALQGRLLENIDPTELFSPVLTSPEPPSSQQYVDQTGSLSTRCLREQFGIDQSEGPMCHGRFEESWDTNRVPCVYKEYKCLCRRSSFSRLVCRTVYRDMPVLRRVSLDNGSSEWQYRLEAVAVGCTTVTRQAVFAMP